MAHRNPRNTRATRTLLADVPGISLAGAFLRSGESQSLTVPKNAGTGWFGGRLDTGEDWVLPTCVLPPGRCVAVSGASERVRDANRAELREAVVGGRAARPFSGTDPLPRRSAGLLGPLPSPMRAATRAVRELASDTPQTSKCTRIRLSQLTSLLLTSVRCVVVHTNPIVNASIPDSTFDFVPDPRWRRVEKFEFRLPDLLWNLRGGGP